ncbi:MAG TPA: hypothetical protein VN783_05795, partial [Thermoanaerobaculia bacterium]|nr:hypothetical protein [Thermoanaerobaculia bacterium]
METPEDEPQSRQSERPPEGMEAPEGAPPSERPPAGSETPENEPPSEPTEPTEKPPEGSAWRADALAASRHSRLADEMRPPRRPGHPATPGDEEAAIELCADLARKRLGDFTPALTCLTEPERRRAQALLAYASALFDFARQQGVEGERLAEINRFEFALDEALAGKPNGQPIFL